MSRLGEGLSRLGRLPLRTRLVAGFTAAMLVVLTAAGAFVYWRVEYALDRGLDAELRNAAAVIGPLVGPDGTVVSRASASATGVGWQVLAPDGEVLDSGGPAPDRPLLPAGRLRTIGPDTDTDTDTATIDVGAFLPASDAPYRLRVTTLPAGSTGTAAYLLVGVRRDHRDEALRELLLQLTVAGLAALLVASVVGDLLARAALAPVERYRRRAAEIAAGAAGLRLDVPAGRDDEVTRLGHTLNEMLVGLEEALDRERRFVDDASHELRTPLTLLKSRIQLTRGRERSVAEHEAVLDELAVDVTRLAELAEQLLVADRETAYVAGESDLTSVVREVTQRWAEADTADLIETRLPDGPVPVVIGVGALERIVTNLLANAATHGRPPVEVAVEVVTRADDAFAVLVVSDAGDGMPPDLLSRATHRFTRADDARSRPGAGLGLAIVEQLVSAAGGELRLCSGGQHDRVGAVTDVPCGHDGRMTVAVVLRCPVDMLR